MITWLVQSQADVSTEYGSWLSSAEQAEYAALRVEKRRHDWLVGRWTAKRLIQAARPEARQLPLGAIQVSPARGRAPQADWPGNPRPWPLTISHSHGLAVAALADDPGAPLGIDLEHVAPRPAAFASDYFTPVELASLAGALDAHGEQVTAIWCAKEAALKALGLGLTVDARAVSLWLDRGPAASHGWRRIKVEGGGARLPPGLTRAAEALHGWWRRRGPYVLAIVTGAPDAPASGWPVEMQPVVNQEIAA